MLKLYTPWLAQNLFVSKQDLTGNLKWVRKIETSDACNVVVDPSGNIYILAEFTGILDVDPGPAVYNLYDTGFGFTNCFLLKLDSNANFLWARHIDDKLPVELKNLVRDSAGNVFVGTRDSLIKFDATGNLVWSREVTNEYVGALATDGPGNIYVSGAFWGSNDFDPGPGSFILTGTGSHDGFVAKYSPSGNFVWARQMVPTYSFPASYNDICSIDLTGTSTLSLTGFFDTTIDFDPGPNIYNLTASGSRASFIVRLDTAGNFISAAQISASGLSWTDARLSQADAYGNLYISGTFTGTVDFDPGPGIVNLSSAAEEIFICKFSPNGNLIQANSLQVNEASHNFTIDASGNLYVTGRFYGTPDFDPGLGVFNLSAGNNCSDIFVVKLSQDSCAGMSVIVDSLASIGCLNAQGYISVSGTAGAPPYSYSWNTTPPTQDSVLLPTIPSIYEVTVTDNLGCTRNTSFLIDGPAASTGFDLNQNLVANSLRPGFSSHLALDAFNDGCIPQTGVLKLVLTSQVTYNTATPTPDLIIGDTLIWNFSNFNYDSPHLIPYVNVTTNAATPIGDTVCFTTIITPIAGDADPANNIKTRCLAVVGSYDPNDKSVYPVGACAEGYVLPNTHFTYTVNFQNTGTASAVNIYIVDSLDSHLNLNSVRVVGSSHPMYTEVLPGNVLKFRFDDINLPDSNTSEPASHGYVIYEADHNPGLASGTVIRNRAGIYFDYNPVVLTNEVSNKVVNTIPICPNSVGHIVRPSAMTVYTNPASSTIVVEFEQEGRLTVTDLMGRRLAAYELHALGRNTNRVEIDISSLPAGLYLYYYDTREGRKSGKLLIRH